MDESRGEFAALTRLQSRLPRAPKGETWIGDDAAVIAPPRGLMLLAIDAVVAGVHTDLAIAGLDDLGWKAMAVNASDIAAMGGVPARAVVAVVGPPDLDIDLLYDGIEAAARHYACPVVGGDLSSGPAPVVTVSMTGDCGTDPPVLREGAAPGDEIYVTGPLGASAAGLAHLLDSLASPRGGLARGTTAAESPAARELVRAYRRPAARVHEGMTARKAGASAMIDVSDGLAIDLDRLATASGVGVVLEEVPVAEGASISDALGGGDDYELVFSAPRGALVDRAFEDAGLRTPVCIGRCSPDPAERRFGSEQLPPAGWQHRLG